MALTIQPITKYVFNLGEREKENYVYCRCLLLFWTLLSFLVLVPIIYAIVIELDVLIVLVDFSACCLA